MAKVTPKALQTRQTILEAAAELFSSKWYETVSVPEISRQAGKSSGAFYNYFKNKEEVFLALLESFLDIIAEAMNDIAGETVEERLRSFIEITIGLGPRYKNFVTLFREGQYRYTHMEKKLKEIYTDALSRVYGRDLDENEYLFISGPVRFVSIRSLYHNRPYDQETLESLLLRGMFKDLDMDREKVFAPVHIDEDESPESTREILLAKAAELFGEEGYHQVNVYDITRQTRFAVGTFYRHFESKEQILEELVEMISQKTRSLVNGSVSSDLNPLEQMVRRVYVFIRLFEVHPAYYKIVREAEFVIEGAVEDYYNKFEERYLSKDYPEGFDPLTLANSLLGLAHYFGIEDIFSGNIKDVERGLITLGAYLQQGIAE